MNSKTEGMDRIGDVASNFDSQIDDAIVARLRERPNKAWAGYPAWNFYGRVWFGGRWFNCEVWRYGSPREVIYAETVPSLMNKVSSKYGYG